MHPSLLMRHKCKLDEGHEGEHTCLACYAQWSTPKEAKKVLTGQKLEMIKAVRDYGQVLYRVERLLQPEDLGTRQQIAHETRYKLIMWGFNMEQVNAFCYKQYLKHVQAVRSNVYHDAAFTTGLKDCKDFVEGLMALWHIRLHDGASIRVIREGLPNEQAALDWVVEQERVRATPGRVEYSIRRDDKDLPTCNIVFARN